MKQITMTQTTKNAVIEDFINFINKMDRNAEDTVNYSVKLAYNKIEAPKAKLFFTPLAYMKMMLYVRDTNTEIAWHGVVERDKNTYLVKDVMLYPQTVTGATVDTDQDKYNEWLENLDDDSYNSLRFQGHSHVNFSTSPSGTDLAFYQDILKVLPKNDYYIFMILNKSGSATYLIYDLAANLIYENADILVGIADPNAKPMIEIFDQISTQKTDYVKDRVYTTLPNYNKSYSSYPKSTLNDFDDYEDDFWKDYDARHAADVTIDSKYKNAKLRAKVGRPKKK